MTKLHELHAAGQSVWLDYIRRDMLDGGELRALVNDGVRGLTSNPTIFLQAIEGSDTYDEQIRSVIANRPGATTMDMFEELAVHDIKRSADALLEVYTESGRLEGFVSPACSPHLA